MREGKTWSRGERSRPEAGDVEPDPETGCSDPDSEEVVGSGDSGRGGNTAFFPSSNTGGDGDGDVTAPRSFAINETSGVSSSESSSDAFDRSRFFEARGAGIVSSASLSLPDDAKSGSGLLPPAALVLSRLFLLASLAAGDDALGRG